MENINTKDKIKEIYQPCLGESYNSDFLAKVAKMVGCSVEDADAIMAEIEADFLEEYEERVKQWKTIQSKS